ncbi:MAG: DUF488 family protein [Nitrococcus sp.]|nr:DUF488 family protein [Nitrococcus sp.]
MTVRIKRAYISPAREDGHRILVDRLWPRGVRKADAKIERWIKDVGPSTELRQWFGHDPRRWEEFQRRYCDELRHQQEALAELEHFARDGVTTLVFAARDEEHNNAVVLRDLIEDRLG